MIYPEFFPEDRKKEIAENKVFDALKKLSDKYDIFYSKKFVTDGAGKRPEYEIDFIIAKPNEAVVCLEVKGGMISYNGVTNTWSQNGHKQKSIDGQASSASHSLLKTHQGLIGDMAIGWALCFPDCQIQGVSGLPDVVKEPMLIDEMRVMYLEETLSSLFEFIHQQFPYKKGVRPWMYEKFKSQLLRGIGFIQVLNTKIKRDSKRFVELTNKQLEYFQRISDNDNIITDGPAGSGKTIVAKTVAQDFVNDGKKVLFICFNRTLSNKIRYDFDRDEINITVATFHGLARSVIEKYDSSWWNAQEDKKSDEFWNLEVPMKVQDLLHFETEKYDVLIVDEGQDIKEFWYEILFQLVSKNGKRLIFLDEMQNIFGNFTAVPNKDTFIKYSLPENCRNTKSIVKYLTDIIGKNIKSFDGNPIGEEVLQSQFNSVLEQQKFVLDEIKNLLKLHDIELDQILIILNSDKKDSCLAGVTKVGKIPIASLDRSGRMQKKAINYTTINTYKGLEADIVFVVDTHLIDEENKLLKLYTEASRARFKLYLLNEAI